MTETVRNTGNGLLAASGVFWLGTLIRAYGDEPIGAILILAILSLILGIKARL